MALMVSCGGADTGTGGEIGNGAFGYRCTSDRDAACSADDNFVNTYLKAIPGEVAIGGSFALGFLSESSSALDGSAVVGAVSSELLGGGSGSDATFTAKKPGYAGIVAKRG